VVVVMVVVHARDTHVERLNQRSVFRQAKTMSDFSILNSQF
jgi:hypothetical protein